MARAGKSVSVYRPTRHGRRWRIEIRDGVTGERSRTSFDREADAWKAYHDAREEAAIYDTPTVGEMMLKYREHMLTKGNRPGSVVTTMFRLDQFFQKPDKMLLIELTPEKIQALYDDRIKKVSPATHRGQLGQAKTFLKWLVKQRHLRYNPADSVEPVGKKQRGKLQLREGEAARFLQRALALSESGDDGAFAVAVALVMGLRASEVVQRLVRDVDPLAKLLYIEKAKTPAGNRKLEIPDVLWPHFEKRIQDRNPMAPLLPGQEKGFHRREWVRDHTVRICKELGLPPVCAQGLRATHSSIAQEGGVTAHIVAKQLGHENVSTTLNHYTRPGLPEEQTRKKALRVLTGGAP